MSVADVLTRIAELQGVPATSAPAATSTATSATATPAFAAQLASATTPFGAAASPVFAAQLASATPLGAATALGAAPTDAASRMVALAQAEVGQAEQPPGSNDSARIATYRQATAGSGVGPWCAYFTSWLAQQSGAPLGEVGQGFGSVDALRGWAQRTGRTTDTPAPGELVVWDEHIGVVESVDPDGSIHTIEGNSSNAVTRRTYGPDGGGAQAYVRV